MDADNIKKLKITEVGEKTVSDKANENACTLCFEIA